MRIGIIGAGAVGGTLAALLTRAGHEVVVAARGAGLAAVRSSGIHLTGAWGESIAMVEADTILRGGVELAIVTTKAQDAVEAAGASALALSGIPVLVMQNGLASLDDVRARLPNSDVIGGLAIFAASYLNPGEMHVTASGSIVIGGDQLGTALGSLFASRVLSEVIPIAVTHDFIGAQWSKLIVNQVNALPAITGLSAQGVIAHAGLRRIMMSSIREQIHVARALKIRFGNIQGLSDRMLRFLGQAPEPLAQLLPRAFARRMGPIPNPGSTQQSIRRGVPTEIDYLNGAVVRAGVRASVPTPVNAAMVQLVHEVEAGAQFLTPEQVVNRVRLR